MIKINDIKDSTADLYDPEGNKVGTIETVLQLDDVRIQIKNEEAEGYYVIWKGLELPINKDGMLGDAWPRGFFDISTCQLEQLLSWGPDDKNK